MGTENLVRDSCGPRHRWDLRQIDVKRDEGCDRLAVNALAAPPPRLAGEGWGGRRAPGLGNSKRERSPGRGASSSGGRTRPRRLRGARPAKCGADSNDNDDDDDDNNDKNKNDNNSNSSNVLCQRGPRSGEGGPLHPLAREDCPAKRGSAVAPRVRGPVRSLTGTPALNGGRGGGGSGAEKNVL